MQTEFNDQVKEILINELQDLLKANDHYHSSSKIDLTRVDLNEDEDELVKLTSAEVEYELFFDEDVTLVFSSKLVYKTAIPGADEFIDESDLRRFDVPFCKYRSTYEDEAYEEL